MLRVFAVGPILAVCGAAAAEPAPPPAKPQPVPPKLTVEVTNIEVNDIQLVKVDKPACWLPLYLTMTLDTSTGTRVGEERHVFELVSYEYNESMRLRYWGPVAVED